MFVRVLQAISEVDDSKRLANVEVGLAGESITLILEPFINRFLDAP